MGELAAVLARKHTRFSLEYLREPTCTGVADRPGDLRDREVGLSQKRLRHARASALNVRGESQPGFDSEALLELGGAHACRAGEVGHEQIARGMIVDVGDDGADPPSVLFGKPRARLLAGDTGTFHEQSERLEHLSFVEQLGLALVGWG